MGITFGNSKEDEFEREHIEKTIITVGKEYKKLAETGKYVETEVPIEIYVVKDQPCPYCGAYWGNPNKELDFPNRIKVTDEQGNWWKCYNPKCPVSYYNPEIKEVELTKGQFPYPYIYVRR